MQALLDGEVDAFTSDGMALRNFAEGQPLKVVGDPFSKEPYGSAVPKGDQRLRQLIDKTLLDMEKDGTYAAIYKRWFGDEVSPYPLGEAAAPVAKAASADQAATAAPDAAEPATAAGATTATYVVQPGDTLSRIASTFTGTRRPAPGSASTRRIGM